MCLTSTLDTSRHCGSWALRLVCGCRAELLDDLARQASPRWLTAPRPPVPELANWGLSLLDRFELRLDLRPLFFTLVLLALLMAVHRLAPRITHRSQP